MNGVLEWINTAVDQANPAGNVVTTRAPMARVGSWRPHFVRCSSEHTLAVERAGLRMYPEGRKGTGAKDGNERVGVATPVP